MASSAWTERETALGVERISAVYSFYTRKIWMLSAARIPYFLMLGLWRHPELVLYLPGGRNKNLGLNDC